MHQGYWQQALQALEDGIRMCTGSTNDDALLCIQVQMQICFLKPIVTGSFIESLKSAAQLHADFLTRKASNPPARAVVRWRFS
jgi:hypothetical protein